MLPVAPGIWVALFGTLGWNLIDLGARPPRAAAGTDVGLLLSGAPFGLLAQLIHELVPRRSVTHAVAGQVLGHVRDFVPESRQEIVERLALQGRM